MIMIQKGIQNNKGKERKTMIQQERKMKRKEKVYVITERRKKERKNYIKKRKMK